MLAMAQTEDLYSAITTPNQPSPTLLHHLSFVALGAPLIVPPPPDPFPLVGGMYVPPPASEDHAVKNILGKAIWETQNFWRNSIQIDTFATNSTDSIYYLPLSYITASS
jgi:hypothetical protein